MQNSYEQSFKENLETFAVVKESIEVKLKLSSIRLNEYTIAIKYIL